MLITISKLTIYDHYNVVQGLKSFSVGIIGGGKIGNHIIRDLLNNGFTTGEIMASTRRQETLGDFASHQVEIVQSNAIVASSVRFLIIACKLLQSRVS